MNNKNSIEEHDEGYFASFTDMLVGVLFIFIILLVLVASNYHKAEKEVNKAVEEITSIAESRNIVLKKIKRSLENEGVIVDIDEEQGILRLPESILFPQSKSNLSVDGKLALEKLSNILGRYLPCLAVSNEKYKEECADLNLRSLESLETVLIEGHTDSIPYGKRSMYTNWNLSSDRAISVFKEIVKNRPFLDTEIKNRLGFSVLGISGYEARRPVENNYNQDTQKANRRIDIRLIMRSPSLEDIEKLQNAIK